MVMKHSASSVWTPGGINPFARRIKKTKVCLYTGMCKHANPACPSSPRHVFRKTEQLIVHLNEIDTRTHTHLARQ